VTKDSEVHLFASAVKAFSRHFHVLGHLILDVGGISSLLRGPPPPRYCRMVDPYRAEGPSGQTCPRGFSALMPESPLSPPPAEEGNEVRCASQALTPPNASTHDSSLSSFSSQQIPLLLVFPPVNAWPVPRFCPGHCPRKSPGTLRTLFRKKSFSAMAAGLFFARHSSPDERSTCSLSLPLHPSPPHRDPSAWLKKNRLSRGAVWS